MKEAIIDVGSNSVRLMLWQDGKTVDKTAEITRLAENMGAQATLQPSAVERTVRAVCFFYEKAKTFGAECISVFATAAVRNAVNGKEFTDAVKERCGVVVDVISGQEEATLGALGALNGGDGCVVDVGGASSEIIVVKNGVTVYSHSLSVGAVTLTDNSRDKRDVAESILRDKLSEYGKVPVDRHCEIYAIGGTATNVAAITLKLPVYDREKVHGYRLTVNGLKKLVNELFATSVEKRDDIVGVQKGRGKIIACGTLLLLSIAEYLNAEEITVSESDNLEGYALSHRKDI